LTNNKVIFLRGGSCQSAVNNRQQNDAYYILYLIVNNSKGAGSL